MLPLIITNEQIDSDITEIEQQDMPSKTYLFDFETGEIRAEFIDGIEAIKQAAVKTIKTIRDRYLIYSSDYGCEVFYLIGQNHSLEYLKIEVPRLIREALVVDERIIDCTDFEVTRDQGIVNVVFTIETIFDSSVVVEVEI